MLKIGFDIGGTNIAAGLVDDALEIVRRKSVAFPLGKGYLYTAELLYALANELLSDYGADESALDCVGIAIPGSIDNRGEVVLNAYNLQFHNVPLRAAVQAHFKTAPVFLANDANAAALAELCKGAFMGCKTAALVTLGTGVGGGLILNGKMFNGGLNNGVELGHTVLSHGGDICTCGVRGCVETRCTASWLVREGRRSVVEFVNSMIYTEARGVMDNVTAKLVIDCAKAGDRIAVDIFKRYVDALGSAIASLINLLDPEVIALGGGVSLAGDFLLLPLKENVRKKAFFLQYGRIEAAQMGNEAGVIGAAMLRQNAEG